jgi:sec-independent protein translocase protein TatA
VGIPSGWELIVLIGVLVLLFGSTKLPGAARAIGQSMRIFKAETKDMRSESEDGTTPSTPQKQSQQQSLPPSGPAATPVKEPQRHNDTTR